jgi:WD40 repeat protein
MYKVTMKGHTDSVTCIAEDGKMLLTGSDDMSIGVWNTVNWYYEDNVSKGKT